LVAKYTYRLPAVALKFQIIQENNVILQTATQLATIEIKLLTYHLLQLSSTVKHIFPSTNDQYSASIFAISEEGLLHCISTINGKTLSSLLPTSGVSIIKQVAQSRITG
jgi:hypothetical protein